MVSRQLHSLSMAILFLLFAGTSVRAQGALRGRVSLIRRRRDCRRGRRRRCDPSAHAYGRAGRFAFSNVPRGEHEISVRRLGYQPTTTKGVVGAISRSSYDIVMSMTATVVAGVDVNASEQRSGSDRGLLSTPRSRGRWHVFHPRGNCRAKCRAAPPTYAQMSWSTDREASRWRKRREVHREAPVHALYLAGRPGIHRNTELDNISVTDIEGMELYSGPSTTPMQFSHGWLSSDCGAIVVWTRIPGSA